MKLIPFTSEQIAQAEAIQCPRCLHKTDTLYMLSDGSEIEAETVLNYGVCGDCIARQLAEEENEITHEAN